MLMSYPTPRRTIVRIGLRGLASMLLMAVALGAACQAAAGAEATAPVDEAGGGALRLGPVVPGATTRLEELLRGFTDEELAAAQRAVPTRSDPGLKPPVPRQVHVTGTVFLDKNQNGARDAGEEGLGSVFVTDGEILTRTDAAGAFRLSFRFDEETHCRFVIATRPTGYTPVGPWFLRIGFAETETQYRADFAFVEDAHSAQKDFWFISTSDSQFTEPGTMLSIAKDYAQVTEAPGSPAFLLTVGDLTMEGSHWQWDMYERIRAASRVMVYDGFGGHDGNCLRPRSTVNYELRVGPPYYSFNYGGVHFVQFVTEKAYLGPKAHTRQESWLHADLRSVAQGTPVVVATHYPLPAEWFDQRKQEGVNVVCQLAGHWHAVQAGSRNRVPVLIAAPARNRDWGAFTTAYRWIRVASGSVSSELRVAGQYQRLKCLAPGPEAATGSQPLVVLAYDSARLVKKVTCDVTSPQGKRQTLELARQGDWSWHGLFSPDVPGDWRVALRAIDTMGAEWRRAHTVRVTDARLATPHADGDFPWILAGDPPRRLPAGPGAPLYPLWVKYTGSVHVLHASPAVAHGNVYVAVTNPNAGSPGSGVLCLDAKTGEERWRAASPLGDIRGPVTVHGSWVYAITGESWVAAFDARTGQRVWSTPLDESYRLGRPLAVNQSPPVPTPQGILATDWQTPQILLDPATGRELARLQGNAGAYAAFTTVFDGTMYSAWRGHRMAIKIPSGQVAWKGEESARSTSAGIVVQDKFLYTGGSTCKAIDAAGGNLRWQCSVSNAGYQQPVPVVWDDLVLINGTQFTAADLTSGKARWTVACGRDPERFARCQRQFLAGSSTPLVAGGLAYFGHDDSSLRAVDRGGKVCWEYRLGTPIKTSPVVSGNLLFVHDYAGNLWCFAPGK